MSKKPQDDQLVVKPGALYDTENAARFLGLAPGTLSNARSTGAIPLPFTRLGRRTVRYLGSDILDFVAKRTARPADLPLSPSPLKRRKQATQPGASSPVAQGGVAGNPVQSQPVAFLSAGDAAVGAGAATEGVAAPGSTDAAAPDVTELPAVYAPSVEALVWLPLSQPPEQDEGVLLWLVGPNGPDEGEDWQSGVYQDGEFAFADGFAFGPNVNATHYAIVRGPFN